MPPRQVLAGAACVAPFVLFLAIYLPAAGHGFVRDDYTWILRSRIGGVDDLVRVVRSDLGFYRPVVGLTFAVNAWMFGAEPRGYGLTNVLLALLCCGSIVLLARALRLPPGASVMAGASWLLHVSFMRLGVLWISGRTALLVTLAATCCATALLRGRLWLALLGLAAALLSKEEAVLLPVVLLSWLVVLRKVPGAPVDPAPVPAWSWVATAGLVEAAYLLARATTNATTPFNAPEFYRLTWNPEMLAANTAVYAIATVGLSAAVVLLAVAVLGRPRLPLAGPARVAVWCGACWVAGTLAITVFVPVRSDLYVALPAVGACLSAAALCAECWARASNERRTRAMVAALVIVLALAPVHVVATRGWIQQTRFASRVLSDLETAVAPLPGGATVVLADDRNDPHGNLASVFGTMLNDAYIVAAGRRLSLWIEPAPPHAAIAGLAAPCRACVDLRLKLKDGRLRKDGAPSRRSQ